MWRKARDIVVRKKTADTLSSKYFVFPEGAVGWGGGKE